VYAVIHEIESTSTHGLIPIAGRPLVARQIQWLRSVRCQGIAVQIGLSAESVALGQWLRRDAVGTNVRLVLSSKPLTPRQLARRAGFPDDDTLLAIPADVLCGGDIESIRVHARPRAAVVALPAPAALSDVFAGSAVRIVGDEIPWKSARKEAWAVRVRSFTDAFTIGIAVLEGRLERRAENGVLLHASERERDIWVGRGAHIDPRAQIIAPVLVGADAVICAGARVGPRVFLGERCVVENNTRLANSMVAPGTIVGADLDLSGIALDARGTQDLFTGEYATIDETLLLTRRDKPHQTSWTGRGLAIFVLLLLLPVWAIVSAVMLLRSKQLDSPVMARVNMRPLHLILQTIRGERIWIGLSEWTTDLPDDVSAPLFWKAMSAPCGLIPIDTGLAPEGADIATRLRSRIYYMHVKNHWLDLRLVLRCLGRWLARLARRTAVTTAENPGPEVRAAS
jgi:NDP-sugar pyrophosphorylase family protein